MLGTLRYPRALARVTALQIRRSLDADHERRTPEIVKSHYDDLAGETSSSWAGARVSKRIVGGKLVEISRHEFIKGRYDEYASYIAAARPATVLEVGAGELTSIHEIAQRIDARFVALDLSHTRVLAGVRAGFGQSVDLCLAASAAQLPFADDSFDVVYTCSALEQMQAILPTAIAEIARVAKREVILFEPSFELADAKQLLRMLTLDYVRGIARTIRNTPTLEFNGLYPITYAGRHNHPVARYHAAKRQA